MNERHRPDMAGPAYPYRRKIPRVFTVGQTIHRAEVAKPLLMDQAVVFHRRPDNGQPVGVDRGNVTKERNQSQSEVLLGALLRDMVSVARKRFFDPYR